jgi:RimJ/RimL family protein N-acetyltransferase
MDEANLEKKFGRKVHDLEPAPSPKDGPIHGNLVTLIRLLPSHAEGLYTELEDRNNWDYLAVGPFETKETFYSYIFKISQSVDPFFYAVISNSTSSPVGYIALMRIVHSNRVCEIGHVTFSPKSLQRTRAATEVFHLLLKEAFGYLRSRRVEWKCNALNEPSKKAAVRLGFQFEGVFRNHSIVKGRSRDSCWYSMVEHEWPETKEAFELWLDSPNFDEDGRQRTGLVTLRQNLETEKDEKKMKR